MCKCSTIIEWTFVENDVDWERQCALFQPANEQTDHQRSLSRYCWIVVALLLLLMTTDNGWRTTQIRAQPTAIVGVALAQRDWATAPPPINQPTIVEQLADRQAVAEFQAAISWQSQSVGPVTGLQRVQPAHCGTPSDSIFATGEDHEPP